MQRFALVISAVVLAFSAVTAGAEPQAPTPTTTTAAAASDTPTVDSDTATGSIDVEPSFERRMADCMAVWDKGTHMTKAQWRRTCKTTLDGP